MGRRVSDRQARGLHNSFPSVGRASEVEGWQYEQEWRYVPFKEAPTPNRDRPMPRPSRVFLGAKAPPSTTKELFAICVEKNIAVWQMRMSSRYGRHLNYIAQRLMFLRLLKSAGIHAVPGERGPSLHSFRHSFAVRRLTLWHRARRDVQELLPHLAVYLGHVGPENTYWYLSGTPELLHTAGTRFESQHNKRRIEPMTASTRVGPLLQIFFTDHLVAQRRLSLQTVASYRDTFRLLLQFVHRKSGIEPAVLEIRELDAEIIFRFLDALEKDRGNTIVSRNLRLTAIRSFYRMVALRDPESVGIATRVQAIPLKRANTQVRQYVTREEMEAILASIDRTGWCGRRDCALLLTMYKLRWSRL
jgi:site-specific recombinase XerD